MDDVRTTAFEDLPRDREGHFVLRLYAAIYRVIEHLRRLEGVGGLPLEELFQRFGFLGEYFEEMRRRMPGELTWAAAGEWWEREIASWEERCAQHLPLRALGASAGLSFESLAAFSIVGLVEEDSRFGTLFAELQQPIAQRRPTTELVGRIAGGNAEGAADPWRVVRPLISAGFVEAVDAQGSRSEWALRVPHEVWDALRRPLDERPIAGCRLVPRERAPHSSDLIVPEELRERMLRLPALLARGEIGVLVVRAAPGADSDRCMATIAAACGRGCLEIGPTALRDARSVERLGPICTLDHALPVLRFDLAPGETIELPELRGYRGPVGVVLGNEGGVRLPAGVTAVTVELPPADPELRRRHWEAALGVRRLADADAVVRTFRVGGAYIHELARNADALSRLEGRAQVELADVRRAARALNRQQLDTLAARMPTSTGWDGLVVRESTAERLRELEDRCAHREALASRLGTACDGDPLRGVRALFTGASGTGKTFAARVLATELGMDLYRVDLAAIVNKYIGETEKNLHQVLTRAEALDVVLLLDEGDALLGQRTEVRSANDRYANLETNYLLQRLESYQGVVVITTNLGENLDRAFQRRMDVVVTFFPPQAEERRRILELHLPADHRVDAAFLERVALQCELTGGQLRNVAVQAVVAALAAERARVDARDLDRALRSEYRKAGGTYPLAAESSHARRDGGVAAFLESFVEEERVS